MKTTNSNKVVTIIALIVALAVGGYSAFNLYNVYNYATTNVQAVVPTTDIKIFQTITAENVEWASVPQYAVDENTCLQMDDIIGSSPKFPLYKDKPIDMRNMASEQDMKDYQTVGVNIGSASTANVQPGDLVDVYWVNNSNEQQAWSGTSAEKLQVPATAALIARNARVIEVSKEDRLTASSTVVYLLVSSQDVPAVIRGSTSEPSDGGIALAKKANV